MSTREQLHREASPLALNITPLIDMVFILLIFFAVNASFVKEAGVEIERPSARTAETRQQANIMIAVTENGEVWVDRQRVDPSSVRGHVERLHAENPEGSVVILADKASQTGLVIQVLDQARLAGIETKQGVLVNDRLQTSINDVFAAGDVTGKGWTVIDAIAMGRKVAYGIDVALRGAEQAGDPVSFHTPSLLLPLTRKVYVPGSRFV